MCCMCFVLCCVLCLQAFHGRNRQQRDIVQFDKGVTATLEVKTHWIRLDWVALHCFVLSLHRVDLCFVVPYIAWHG